VKYILEVYQKAEPENPLFKPIPLLNNMIEKGNFGVKTGKGFYEYNKK
jgi:3-hydroxyacyl-CoA dehydrogenase